MSLFFVQDKPVPAFLFTLRVSYPTTTSSISPTDPEVSSAMCYLVLERYSICRCLYYKHSVDMCAAYGQQGHGIAERTVLVGYTCDIHSDYTPSRQVLNGRFQ